MEDFKGGPKGFHFHIYLSFKSCLGLNLTLLAKSATEGFNRRSSGGSLPRGVSLPRVAYPCPARGVSLPRAAYPCPARRIPAPRRVSLPRVAYPCPASRIPAPRRVSLPRVAYPCPASRIPATRGVSLPRVGTGSPPGPIAALQLVGDVRAGDQSRHLLHHPQEVLAEGLSGLEPLQIQHHVLQIGGVRGGSDPAPFTAKRGGGVREGTDPAPCTAKRGGMRGVRSSTMYRTRRGSNKLLAHSPSGTEYDADKQPWMRPPEAPIPGARVVSVDDVSPLAPPGGHLVCNAHALPHTHTRNRRIAS
eukprot:171775-Prorocentrum_minimum.AAC.2